MPFESFLDLTILHYGQANPVLQERCVVDAITPRIKPIETQKNCHALMNFPFI